MVDELHTAFVTKALAALQTPLALTPLSATSLFLSHAAAAAAAAAHSALGTTSERKEAFVAELRSVQMLMLLAPAWGITWAC